MEYHNISLTVSSHPTIKGRFEVDGDSVRIKTKWINGVISLVGKGGAVRVHRGDVSFHRFFISDIFIIIKSNIIIIILYIYIYIYIYIYVDIYMLIRNILKYNFKMINYYIFYILHFKQTMKIYNTTLQ